MIRCTCTGCGEHQIVVSPTYMDVMGIEPEITSMECCSCGEMLLVRDGHQETTDVDTEAA